MNKERMSKRLKLLGAATITAATMAASAQAATVLDFASEGSSTLRHAFVTSFPHVWWQEPLTMIIIGTILLAAFRGHRRA